MTESYRLETPEAVSLAYDIAGIGSRFLATLLDTLIWVAVIVAGGLAALFYSLNGGDQTIAYIFVITLAFIVMFGYYIFFETLWEGQTPGKRAMHIRVLKTTGYPISLVDAVIRNLVRLIDQLPVLYGLGVVVMFISPESRRLGDYAAGTVVVKERISQALALTPVTPPAEQPSLPARGAVDPEELLWNTRALNQDDVRIMREFLQRVPQLKPDSRVSLGNDIAARVARAIGARDPLDGERFLQRVLVLWEDEHRL